MLTFLTTLLHLLPFLTLTVSLAPSVPTFPLHNTAQPSLTIPAIGVGTGGYAFNPSVGYGGWPECFDDASGCDQYSFRTITEWLSVGGRRLDLANTYGNTRSVGRAIRASSVRREDMFILEKIGPGQFDVPLGYNETHIQFRQILEDLGTDYVDLLLIHWPTQVVPQSTDPYCRMGDPTTYDERQCRLSTWKAMLEIFDSKRARAVGVSNFNITHLQEIIDAGLRLPAYNQCPFHLYRSQTQQQLRDFCASKNITFGGYSPLGVPDWQLFPSNVTGMAWTPMADETVRSLAVKYGKSPAQVLLQWQFAMGIPTNPRSQNIGHMRENLASFDFSLTSDEMSQLSKKPQDLCVKDPSWYECANVTGMAVMDNQEVKEGFFSKLFNW